VSGSVASRIERLHAAHLAREIRRPGMLIVEHWPVVAPPARVVTICTGVPRKPA
jgi:hypothetical protein